MSESEEQQRKLRLALDNTIVERDRISLQSKLLYEAADAVAQAGGPLAADSMGDFGKAMKELIELLSQNP